MSRVVSAFQIVVSCSDSAVDKRASVSFVAKSISSELPFVLPLPIGIYWLPSGPPLYPSRARRSSALACASRLPASSVDVAYMLRAAAMESVHHLPNSALIAAGSASTSSVLVLLSSSVLRTIKYSFMLFMALDVLFIRLPIPSTLLPRSLMLLARSASLSRASSFLRLVSTVSIIFSTWSTTWSLWFCWSSVIAATAPRIATVMVSVCARIASTIAAWSLSTTVLPSPSGMYSAIVEPTSDMTSGCSRGTMASLRPSSPARYSASSVTREPFAEPLGFLLPATEALLRCS